MKFIPDEWVDKWKRLSGDFCNRLRTNTGKVDNSGYEERQILDLADKYGVSGILYSKGDSHMNLISHIIGSDLYIYDPFDEVSQYDIDSFNPEGRMILTTRLLEELNAKTGREFMPMLDIECEGTEDYRRTLRHVEAIGYDLVGSSTLGVMQNDNCNCGPLCLYAAIVGNANSPKHREKLDWDALKKDFGLKRNHLVF